jgi:hypothetical protein
LFVAYLAQQRSITQIEKGQLKDLIIRKEEALFAAFEAFELNNDVSDLIDTWKRVIQAYFG